MIRFLCQRCYGVCTQPRAYFHGYCIYGNEWLMFGLAYLYVIKGPAYILAILKLFGSSAFLGKIDIFLKQCLNTEWHLTDNYFWVIKVKEYLIGLELWVRIFQFWKNSNFLSLKKSIKVTPSPSARPKLPQSYDQSY